jgi:hypothetical protein
MSRSMPMDSMTSALRSEPSAYCCAAIAVRLAADSGGCVLRSVSQAMPTCTSAPTTADQPSTGLMAKIRMAKTMEAGASMSAVSTEACRKSRTVRRSFIDCTMPPGTRRRLASKRALKTRADILRSSAIPASCRIAVRTHSSSSMSM